MAVIPYGRQNITQSDIDEVINALQSDFLTQGPRILEFEKAFANYVGAEYAVAVANGTAALHLCAMVQNVDSQSKVITTPITFAASANCIRYCGGEIIFADIDPETYLIDISSVERLIEENEGSISGIIPVDFAGRAVDLKRLRKIADKHGIWIIEDACHAPGGFNKYGDETSFCGNGKYADLAIFSFHPVKHIAAGEGGMITTNSLEKYTRLMELRTHGITRESSKYSNELEWAAASSSEEKWPGWYMELQELGYNYRITDIQAALAHSQLNRAEEGVTRRREIAKIYNDNFAGEEWLIRQSGVVEGHAYHLYVLEVEDRIGLYKHLRENKIFAQIHYIPLHLMPYYKEFGWSLGDMPEAEEYYKNCISLPMYPTLTSEEQEFVINTIKEYYL